MSASNSFSNVANSAAAKYVIAEGEPICITITQSAFVLAATGTRQNLYISRSDCSVSLSEDLTVLDSPLYLTVTSPVGVLYITLLGASEIERVIGTQSVVLIR